MGFQGFSQRMELAKVFSKVKSAKPADVTQAEKDRRKQVAQVRADARRAENLAQRDLIQRKRFQS